MHYRQIAPVIGLLTAATTTLGQTTPPTKARLLMWAEPANGAEYSINLRDPASAIPTIRDDSFSTGWYYPDTDTPGSAMAQGTAAGTATYNALIAAATDTGGGSVAWIDGTHLAVFPRMIASDMYVPDPPCAFDDPPCTPRVDPLTDSRTQRGADWPYAWSFFYPNDRLPGLWDDLATVPPNHVAFPTAETVGQYAPGAGNRSYRHPFLLNATSASPLRAYMTAYAERLKDQLSNSAAGPIRYAQPLFYFDAEQAHIVQFPTGRSAVYMLWYLTQVNVPGSTTTRIWDTFKVPGSSGWVTPAESELDNPSTTTGFGVTTGQTLDNLYLAEVEKRNPSHTDPAWPTTRAGLQSLLNDAITATPGYDPGDSRIRGIMLWWNEVCAKAEAQVWENAVFGPLHTEFPDSKFSNYQQMTVDGKLDSSSTVRDIGQLPCVTDPDGAGPEIADGTNQTSEDASLIEVMPRSAFNFFGSNFLWRDGGPIDGAGTQRRWGFFNPSMEGVTGAVAENVLDSPEMYFKSGTRYFHPAGAGADQRFPRMADPSLPLWAQVSVSTPTEPAANTHEFFRWREHEIFQNLLEFRHNAESPINSDHLTDSGVQHGLRQDGLMPWIFQEIPLLPSTTPERVYVEAWIRQWSSRVRNVMAMLRAQGSPLWGVFMNAYADNDINNEHVVDIPWSTLWYRTAMQRDEVYTATVSNYSALTGSLGEGTGNPHDVDRLNDTLRRGENDPETQHEYVVNNTNNNPIAHGESEEGMAGRVTRTIVEVTLFPQPWLDTCTSFHTENAPSNLGTGYFPHPTPSLNNPYPPTTRQLAGSYEINIETTASCGHAQEDNAEVGMMLEAWNYVNESWDIVPLEPLTATGRAIYAAPMTNYASSDPSPAVLTQTVKTRRRYLLKEPQFMSGGSTPPATAQYTQTTGTSPDATATMKLKLVQASGSATTLTTTIDLVQVIPLCVYDSFTDNASVPRRFTENEPTEMQDAGAALGQDIIGDIRPWVSGQNSTTLDEVCNIASVTENPLLAMIDLSDPGVVFLNSAFCHQSPAMPDAFYPATLYIQMPTWVRSDDVEHVPVRVVAVNASAGEPNNYADGQLSVEVRAVGQTGRSSIIAISGLSTVLLPEGTYEVTPIRESGGLVIDSNVNPSQAVDDFHVRFTLLSDCNNNGRVDVCESMYQFVEETFVDVWPHDGLIDACHPEICNMDYFADGNIDQDDINALAACIAGDCSLMDPHADPDFNHDGTPDQSDITALIDAIAAGHCP